MYLYPGVRENPTLCLRQSHATLPLSHTLGSNQMSQTGTDLSSIAPFGNWGKVYVFSTQPVLSVWLPYTDNIVMLYALHKFLWQSVVVDQMSEFFWSKETTNSYPLLNELSRNSFVFSASNSIDGGEIHRFLFTRDFNRYNLSPKVTLLFEYLVLMLHPHIAEYSAD